MTSESIEQIELATRDERTLRQWKETAEEIQALLRAMNYAAADGKLTGLLNEIHGKHQSADARLCVSAGKNSDAIAAHTCDKMRVDRMEIAPPEGREFVNVGPYERRYDVGIDGDEAVYRVSVTPQVYWPWPLKMVAFESVFPASNDGSVWIASTSSANWMRFSDGAWANLDRNEHEDLPLVVGSTLAKAMGFTPPQFIDIESGLFRKEESGTYSVRWRGSVGRRVPKRSANEQS